jgi:hypothetical protein
LWARRLGPFAHAVSLRRILAFIEGSSLLPSKTQRLRSIRWHRGPGRPQAGSYVERLSRLVEVRLRARRLGSFAHAVSLRRILALIEGSSFLPSKTQRLRSIRWHRGPGRPQAGSYVERFSRLVEVRLWARRLGPFAHAVSLRRILAFIEGSSLLPSKTQRLRSIRWHRGPGRPQAGSYAERFPRLVEVRLWARRLGPFAHAVSLRRILALIEGSSLLPSKTQRLRSIRWHRGPGRPQAGSYVERFPRLVEVRLWARRLGPFAHAVSLRRILAFIEGSSLLPSKTQRLRSIRWHRGPGRPQAGSYVERLSRLVEVRLRARRLGPFAHAVSLRRILAFIEGSSFLPSKTQRLRSIRWHRGPGRPQAGSYVERLSRLVEVRLRARRLGPFAHAVSLRRILAFIEGSSFLPSKTQRLRSIRWHRGPGRPQAGSYAERLSRLVEVRLWARRLGPFAHAVSLRRILAFIEGSSLLPSKTQRLRSIRWHRGPGRPQAGSYVERFPRLVEVRLRARRLGPFAHAVSLRRILALIEGSSLLPSKTQRLRSIRWHRGPGRPQAGSYAERFPRLVEVRLWARRLGPFAHAVSLRRILAFIEGSSLLPSKTQRLRSIRWHRGPGRPQAGSYVERFSRLVGVRLWARRLGPFAYAVSPR